MALITAGSLVGPVLGANELEEGFQGVHQHHILVVGAPQNCCRQCLCPRGVSSSCPAPPSPGDSPRPAGQSGPDSYQATSSALRPGSHMILCASLKDEASIFYSLLGPLKAPWPSKSNALGAHLPGSGPAEVNVGFRPLTPMGEPL